MYHRVSGFSVIPPVGWNEVQAHQKIRANAMYCLRGDNTTLAWQLHRDTQSLSKLHAFELHFQVHHILLRILHKLLKNIFTLDSLVKYYA